MTSTMTRVPMTADEAARMTDREWDDARYVEAAREALERPSDYGHWGDDRMFYSVGQTIGRSRDSDTLEESNYRSVLRDMSALAEYLHPGEGIDWVFEHRASHWLCGWVANIAVRVLAEYGGPVTADNLTPEFIAVTNIAIALREQYPVYDESDHSELESEENDRVWENCTWPDFKSSNSEDDRAYENGEPARDAEYLDSLDQWELMSEISNYACEYDPSTWDESEIWAGIVRLAEQEAYESLS